MVRLPIFQIPETPETIRLDLQKEIDLPSDTDILSKIDMGDIGNLEALNANPDMTGSRCPLMDDSFPKCTLTQAHILRLYSTFLAQCPDREGAKYWFGVSDAGKSTRFIAENFYVVNKSKALYHEELSDEAFVIAAFRNSFARDPVEDENTQDISYWVGELRKPDFGRFELLLFFSDSDEIKITLPFKGHESCL